MDTELWKGVLKAEASLVEKERSLNEVQAKREQLWGEREALVATMRSELSAEQVTPVSTSPSHLPPIITPPLTHTPHPFLSLPLTPPSHLPFHHHDHHHRPVRSVLGTSPSPRGRR